MKKIILSLLLVCSVAVAVAVRTQIGTLNLVPQTQPATAVSIEGDVIYNSSTDAMEVYNGASWDSQASDPSTTKGDLLVSDGSSLDRLPVGTDGQTLEADSTEALGVKWAAPAASLLDVESFTGTDTLDSGNDVALVSGGAFTITLPTAVGITGKQYKIKKTDSVFATASAITIDGNGSETIDGTTTRTLNTEFEYYLIVSDGANWQILEHRTITPWVSYTPGTGGVTIGNGTLEGYWRRVGDTCEFQYRLLMGSTTVITSVIVLNMPVGLATNAAKLISGGSSSALGIVGALDSGTAFRHGYAIHAGNGVSFVSDAGGGSWSGAVPHTWAVNDDMGGKSFLPVTGWSN